MTTFALILVLISAILHALRNFFTKKGSDSQIFIWLYVIFSLLFFAPLFVYSFKVSDFSWDKLYLIILTGGVHSIYWLLLGLGYERGDLSLVYPISRSAPLFIMIFSMLVFKESFSIRGIAGIIIVTGGLYTLQLRGLSLKDVVTSMQLIVKTKVVHIALIIALAVSAYSIIDDMGVSFFNPVVFIFLFEAVAFILYTPFILLRKTKLNIIKEWTLNKKSIIFAGISGIVGYFLVLLAFRIAKVSYVVGFRELSIVFGVLLGNKILGEKYGKIRFLGSSMIFAGAFLIGIAK